MESAICDKNLPIILIVSPIIFIRFLGGFLLFELLDSSQIFHYHYYYFHYLYYYHVDYLLFLYFHLFFISSSPINTFTNLLQLCLPYQLIHYHLINLIILFYFILFYFFFSNFLIIDVLFTIKYLKDFLSIWLSLKFVSFFFIWNCWIFWYYFLKK